MSGLKPLDTTKLESKLAWEKPERKDQAGSLIIFGGVSLKLKEVDTIFKSAKSCGVGSAYALVPESLARVFKRDDQYLIPVNFDNYYGLSDTGQKTFLEEFGLADGLVLADIGNSSATERKLALAVVKTFKPVVIADSSVNLIFSYPTELLSNQSITLVVSLQNLQKIIKVSGLKLAKPLLSTSSFNQKLETLHELSSQIESKVVLVDDKKVLSVDYVSYISSNLKASSSEFCAHLICWQIWSPKSNILEQVFAATSEF